ncbi:condensation domain-containing protein [Moorena sp. SIO3I6]|uniref:condensation domain-containing protein n=1 Tax=Moorena sp. SIO3I6 TaxID=2607831 RepID=UPI0013FB516E|nr:condensation domain-containing protein [Moorena sp. SIO3I6]NEP26670.1 hypothetical protein [Moorena sp. SIO3I6]
MSPRQKKLNTQQIGQMRQYLQHHLCGESVQSDTSGKKNKQAIFILCTGRSGSTLLRVIMAGHPQLFAPPELYLLSFNTLAERKAAFSGRNNFLGEGVIRAIMEIKNCDGEQAQQIMEELEEQNLSTKEFFSLMQEWLPGQIIADKTPPYVFNPEVLQRAEEEFENPLYIHLQRHPLATIRSMKEARLDLLVAMEENQFSVEQKGELMWLISHQNILEFLKNIPSSRQHQLKYEDLVQQPETTVHQLCEFIGIDFHPDMLQPYKEKKQRMTDGVHAVSRMMGDPKFHTYKGINAKVAERWKEEYKVDFLSPETWKVAESLGYEKPDTGVEWNYPEGEFPLSLGQEFYWFRANPRDIHNTAWRIWHLTGPLNRDALKQTFEEIVLRHEPLRTTYKEVNGLPVQVVHPDTRTLAWLEVDLQDLSAEKQADRVQEYLHKEAYYQFNLLEGPILRVHLLRLSEISYVLMPCTTHLAVDAWSMGILMGEIKALYSAIITGQPSPLETPSMTYTEFVRWEYTLRQEAKETVLDYWKQNLAGVKLPELPKDRPNPSLPSCQQGNVDMTIGDDLTRAIEQLSRKAGATLSSCCLAAYSLLLKSFITEGDIVVFSTLGTRPRLEVQSLIGCFATVLPLRINIEDNYTFVELMHEVQQTFKQAYLHKDLCLSQFMEIWKSKGGLHRPFIPVAFNMVNVINSEQLELPNLEIDFQSIERQGVHADFHLRIKAMEGAPMITQFRYRTDLFDFSTIEEVSKRYFQCLESIVSYPEQPIHKLLGTLGIAE